MNQKKNPLALLLKFCGNFILNPVLIILCFLLLLQNEKNEPLSFFYGINIIGIVAFIGYKSNWMKRGRSLIFQMILCFSICFLFPFADHFFITNSIVFIYFIFFLPVFSNKDVYFFKNIKSGLFYNILEKLEAYFNYSSSGYYYQSVSYIQKNNLYYKKDAHLFLENKITGNSNIALSNFEMNVAEQLENVSEKLENAEYNFGQINLGDTLANWAITIPYRPGYIYEIPARQLTNRIIKRTVDILVSLFVIIFFLSWIIPLVGILIKLESRGPILFKQLRSGLKNKPFCCYKMRSMHLNNESDELQATKADKRITKIGSFLRKTSIDELPQFLNVLKGDMSVVGPRPHMLKHTEFYGIKVENYMNRLSIKQGVTGWAQINGFRGETSDISLMEKRIAYDMWYIENWSLWLDIKIMLGTLLKIKKVEKIFRKKSYYPNTVFQK